MTELVGDGAKQKNAAEVVEEQDWASAGGCSPAIDRAAAWTRMGDTCCGDETDGENS